MSASVNTAVNTSTNILNQTLENYIFVTNEVTVD